MIIPSASADDRIRLIAIEMKGAFGNEGVLPLFRLIESGSQESRRRGKALPAILFFLASRFNSDLGRVRFQIFHSGVAHDRDDRCIRSQSIGQSQGGDDISAGGGAGE